MKDFFIPLLLAFNLIAATPSQILNEDQTVRRTLALGGMPAELAQEALIEKVAVSLGVVYRVSFQDKAYYIKFSDRPGARGSFFLKFLIPSDEPGFRYYQSIQRRNWGRVLLESLNREEGMRLVPLPLSFDLCPPSKGGTFELLVNSTEELQVYPELEGLLATLWEGERLEPLEMIDSIRESGNPYDPLDYPIETLKEIAKSYGIFQKFAFFHFLDAIEVTKYPTDTSYQAIERLEHPERKLHDWQDLVQNQFTSLFGFYEDQPLEELSQALFNPSSRERKKLSLTIKKTEATLVKSLEFLRDKLELPEIDDELIDLSLEEVEKAFLSKVPPVDTNDETTYSLRDKLPFNYHCFLAERDKRWDDESVLISKAILQLKSSKQMVDWLKKEPEQLALFIHKLALFEPEYKKLFDLSAGVVLHDAHPRNFLRNSQDGSLTLLDYDDLSIGFEIADLANVYFYKILRRGMEQKLKREDLLPWLEAVIEGYEEGRETTLSEETFALIPVYTAAIFLNHLNQVEGILEPNFATIHGVNQAFSFPHFLEEWDKLLKAIEFLDEIF